MDNMLFSLYNASIRAGDHKARWAYDAISWYVGSGRSYTAWDEALKRCNPDKLISHMARSKDCSLDGLLAACTRYLVRYCKLQYWPA